MDRVDLTQQLVIAKDALQDYLWVLSRSFNHQTIYEKEMSCGLCNYIKEAHGEYESEVFYEWFDKRYNVMYYHRTYYSNSSKYEQRLALVSRVRLLKTYINYLEYKRNG